MTESTTKEHLAEKFAHYCLQIGTDQQVADAIAKMTYGVGIDRSTVCRLRRGEGKPAMFAMATKLLELHLTHKK
ncbi:hypothetical protein [Bowmanella denitrificans]